jgi:hypothetical protein
MVTIKTFLERIKPLCTCLLIASAMAGAWCDGDTRGYEEGYKHGKEDNEKMWRARLIESDYAEYDRKTGVWKLRTMEEVVLTGMIMGKSKPSGYFPEPEVDVKEIKMSLSSKKKS